MLKVGLVFLLVFRFVHTQVPNVARHDQMTDNFQRKIKFDEEGRGSPFPHQHYRDPEKIKNFTTFDPHPECNNSKTTPDNEWGPYYFDHLFDQNISNLSQKAWDYLDKTVYGTVVKSCPIKNKSLVYYYDSFVDAGALLFLYSCYVNRTVSTTI